MGDPVSHQLILLPSGRRGEVPSGVSILDGTRLLGIEIASVCGGQATCNKCLVQIQTGDDTPQSEAHPYVKSCQVTINADMRVYVPESSHAHKQVIRKSASRQQKIAIKPAVQALYITLEEAILGERRGDWERVQAVIAERLNIESVSIDHPALQQLPFAVRSGNGLTLTVDAQQVVIDVQAGFVDGLYGLAVDIGTTTLVAHLCDLQTGAILATESAMNPQVKAGEDVMSRIAYAQSNDGLNVLHRDIIAVLNDLARAVASQAGITSNRIMDAVIVGNTTMIHLLVGMSPDTLGRAPFTPVIRDALDIKARDLKLNFNTGANVHILPAQGGHVGADNVAVLVTEAKTLNRGTSVIVDVGTNAEIVLSTGGQLFSASSPTGPALEGAQITHGMRAANGAIEKVRIDAGGHPRFTLIGDERWSDTWHTYENPPKAIGICGSGIIDVVAELFTSGVMTSDGLLDKHHRSGRVIEYASQQAYLLASAEQTATGQPIVITQKDIRSVQLAKAALYAGIQLLMQYANVSQLDRIILAGAFGSHIDTQRAMVLGLIPDCDLKTVYSVGNAAGDGAVITLLNREKRVLARELAQSANYIELATDEGFQPAFVAALALPHSAHSFVHLSNILPEGLSQQQKQQVKHRPRVSQFREN